MSDMGTKVREMPEAQTLGANDLIYMVSDSTDYKVKGSTVKDAVKPAVMTGATSIAPGSEGLVPAPSVGDNTKYFSGDGTYKQPALSEMSDDATHRLVTDDEKTAWSAKQNILTFDSTPTDGSTNPVTSDGIYDAIASEASARQAADEAVLGAIPTVVANPSGEATAEMQKLQIDSTIYKFATQKAYGEITDVDIASFSDGADNEPLAKLEVGIEAVQSGSGKPSPQNVRPIVGKNAINVLNLDLPNGNYMASDRQISFAWEDGDTEYDMPFNVMANETVKDSSDNDVDVLTLESEYVLPFDIAYDAPEAIYASANDLSAGDYYFKIVNDSWGGNNGKYVSFTIDTILTAGKQIRKSSGAYNVSIEDCTLAIYDSGASTSGTALDFTVSTTQPSSGTDLGQTDGTADLNYWHCVALGYNRWKYSAIRQFLNSDQAKGNWWVQQHKWDVMPSYATTADGFLKGMSADVLAHLKTTKIETARNTVFNSGDTPLGGFDTTYDRVFLASLEQMYIQPQESGEGTYWPYYKGLLNVNSPVARGATYPELKKYDLAAKTTSRSRWLHSCLRGFANSAWYVSSSGNVSYTYAYSALRCAPCLRIGVNKKDTVNLGNTYYGGKQDVTSGVLTVTKGIVDLSTITAWNSGAVNAQTGMMRFLNTINGKEFGKADMLCNLFPTKAATGYDTDTSESISGIKSSNALYLVIDSNRLSGDLSTRESREEALLNWLENNPTYVVYNLDEPTTYQLTPTQVKSLLKDNNIWADSGQIKDLVYVRDLNTYLKSLDDRITALENA